jgi:ABC-type sugar transport system ATPase subunit
MASVTLEHVDKTYPGGTDALIDCSLEVADGEIMVVVGPSGCGKSTLLRLVAGLEQVSAGTLCIGDRVVNDLQPQERNVAMVFQDYALYPHMTARGNLEFPLRMRKLAHEERDRLVDRIAGLLDIGRLLDRLPKQLSGGERQRVAMGRALVREPTVSLFDEPLSNLDAKLRSAVRGEIKELQRRTKTTMIYVTHDQVEAMTLGDHVAILNRGRVQQVATPREVYEQPANAFVAGFIGNPPMNLLPATITAEGGRMVADIFGQRLAIAPDAARTGTIQLGVRPEAITVNEGDGETDAGNGLRLTAERTESLGHETLVYARVAGAPSSPLVIARVPGMRELAAGQLLLAELDAARIQWFGDDGARV